MQQLSGGVASLVSGHIVTMAPDGQLRHFDTVGFVVAASSLVSFLLLWRLQRGLRTSGVAH